MVFDRLILSCIFSKLLIEHDYKTLATCIRVSRIWEEETRRFLYFQLGNGQIERRTARLRGCMFTPNVRDLLDMPTSLERKQLYANAVRFLILNEELEEEDYHQLKPKENRTTTINKLNFPLLRRIKVEKLSDNYMNLFHGVSWDIYLQSWWSTSEEESNYELPPVSQQLNNLCPSLNYLKLYLKIELDEAVADLLVNLPLLETLIMCPFNVSETFPRSQRLFNTVANHRRLQFVDGLPIQTAWIEALSLSSSSKEAILFDSIRYIGLSPGLGRFDCVREHNSWEISHSDYVEAIGLGISMMPRATALHIASSDRTIFEMLAKLPLAQFHELKIDYKYAMLEDVASYPASTMLQSLSRLKGLKVLHMPCFERSQLAPSHEKYASYQISWRTVQDFITSMPQLEELSFAGMKLCGFQPLSERPRNSVYPVIWKRDLGWEIQGYGWSCEMFRRFTGGRYMAHDYFGPYVAEPAFAHWYDNGGNGVNDWGEPYYYSDSEEYEMDEMDETYSLTY